MQDWIIYSLLALIFSSTIILSVKYLGSILSNKDEVVSIVYIAFIIAGIISLIFIINDKKTKHNLNNIVKNKTSNSLLLLFVIILGILIILNYTTQFSAHSLCKISGLPLVIINMNIVLVLFISYFLFSETINWKVILGIMLSLCGLSLVILNS